MDVNKLMAVLLLVLLVAWLAGAVPQEGPGVDGASY